MGSSTGGNAPDDPSGTLTVSQATPGGAAAEGQRAGAAADRWQRDREVDQLLARAGAAQGTTIYVDYLDGR